MKLKLKFKLNLNVKNGQFEKGRKEGRRHRPSFLDIRLLDFNIIFSDGSPKKTNFPLKRKELSLKK